MFTKDVLEFLEVLSKLAKEKKTTELKRCSSCGEKAKVESFFCDRYYWMVLCRCCHFGTKAYKIKSNAVKRWNTRVKNHEGATSSTTTFG